MNQDKFFGAFSPISLYKGQRRGYIIMVERVQPGVCDFRNSSVGHTTQGFQETYKPHRLRVLTLSAMGIDPVSYGGMTPSATGKIPGYFNFLLINQ